jgi:hypothetical protein
MSGGRVLTIAQATVPPVTRGAYLATMAALAERLEVRGTRCWLFERRDRPGVFTEFAEGTGPASPRGGDGDPAEAALEAHLATLATYDDPRHVTWDGVPLADAARS